MWFAYANRRLLLDLIGKKEPAEVLKLRSEKQIPEMSGREYELTFLWRDKPTKRDFLPEIMLVKRNDIRDFLAWTSTYLSSLRPLTAYCRILESEQAKHVIYKAQKPSLGNIKDAFVGVVISEALSHHYNDELIRITPISVKSTYSYVIARACAMGLQGALLEDVARRWEKVREISQQTKRKLKADTIEEVWRVIRILNEQGSAAETSSPHPKQTMCILEACRDISKKGVIEDTNWASLTKDLPKMKNTISVMQRSREQRVEWFEDVAFMLHERSAIDPATSSFLFGYLLSQVAPGSMQHTDILRQHLGRFPTALMWYGLCASLYEKTGIYNELGGLGSRILRDLQEEFNIAERPHADIAFEELEVLFSTEKIDKKFIQENHSYLTVELLPGLYTVVIWPPYEDNGAEKEGRRTETEKTKQSQVSQLSLFASERKTAATTDLLAELGENLRRAQYLYDKLRETRDQPMNLPHKRYSYRDDSRKRRGKP